MNSAFTKLIGISIAGVSFLILGAAYFQNVAAFMLIFLVGALMATPFISGALALVPLRWAHQANWPWRIASAVPVVSLVLAYAGLFVPGIKGFEWARSNLGPPVLFGVWGWSAIAYLAIFATVCPYPHKDDSRPFP